MMMEEGETNTGVRLGLSGFLVLVGAGCVLTFGQF